VPAAHRKRNGGKDVNIYWTPEAVESFVHAKNILFKDLLLTIPHTDKSFRFETDASEVGAVLIQEINNIDKYISFYSKAYTSAQKNYSTREKELLALVMAVEHFHIW
jgi:hypothetical protein